jgi:hypothetical protein
MGVGLDVVTSSTVVVQALAEAWITKNKSQFEKWIAAAKVAS